jgi:acetaldehyde dehydrogenase
MKIDHLSELNFEKIVDKVYSRLREIREYVSFYDLVMPPMITENDILMLSVKVKGRGDYLPPYAGNLDIINCAAIKILENL